MTQLPRGFGCYVTNVGIKDDSDDFVVVAAKATCVADGVFTKSRFAGPSVQVSREHLAGGRARAIVIVSKNANVATGPVGLANARELASGVAERIGCESADVVVASTGVIGRPYPMDRVRAGIAAIPIELPSCTADDAARGIMTTDTVAKVAEATIGTSGARVVGIAKGVGMIEPDMATLITAMFTDAEIEQPVLSASFRRVIDRTFNCVSVDTDTSTSDTAVVLASGVAGVVDVAEFETALHDVALSLTKQIARDGEGAEKLIEVHVDGARDTAQAKRVAKAIVNSPLVKTAVHGADPNWGRVAMAIGKCSDDTDIDQERVVIRFGDTEVYPRQLDDAGLAALSDYMSGTTVLIHVSLATGDADATVWGCDLTAGYVRINADYTT
ncbi:MAG TPA: bifunctional glutamate N-acetyltransferase/amino-acid acetyltransferase ArgJ [Ilumatobacteraceae bacterium]|nr:bifunctional glutamate N-acetyltransferase/amino-acid acetyltransferase ArgJ [Ilumatobacteraceae bacterium]